MAKGERGAAKGLECCLEGEEPRGIKVEASKEEGKVAEEEKERGVSWLGESPAGYGWERSLAKESMWRARGPNSEGEVEKVPLLSLRVIPVRPAAPI